MMPNNITQKVSFASDNHSGVHPQIFSAMAEVNEGSSASYGQDVWSKKLKDVLSKHFDFSNFYFTFNGTAANVLALSTAVRSFESVLCTSCSHLYLDECSAPEKWIGCKLIPVEHKDGKISVNNLAKYIVRKGDQHHSQVKMVSITQPTEYGTTYSLEELNDLKNFCTKNHLYLHIDGARLSNAAYTLECELNDISKYADVITVGGSKNGLMMGDLVLIINPNLNKNTNKYLRKQMLQLPSKSRFISCQFLEYFNSNLSQTISKKQCDLAQLLSQQVTHAGFHVTRPVQSNAVFVKLPQSLVKKIKKQYFFYVWDEKTFECRLMTSFDMNEDIIKEFGTTLKEMA